MSLSASQKRSLLLLVAAILPLALWGGVWIGVNPGDSSDILHPGSLKVFLHGLRFIFPFVAASLAVGVILVRISKHQPAGFGFFSPLGLAALYGAIGLVSALKSPDGSEAIYWAAIYLSAPLVLWAIVWNADILGQLWRLLNVTWLVLIFASLALLAVAAVQFDLVGALTDTTALSKCRSGGWFDLTSGQLRDTGVGRYAAIAAVIAISGVLRWKWWPVWSVVFLASVTLLIFTGARGALIGFIAAGSFIILLHGRRRALIAGIALLAVLTILAATTEILDGFVNDCIFHSQVLGPGTPAGQIPAQAILRLQGVPVQSTDTQLEPALSDLQPNQSEPVLTPAAAAQEGGPPPAGTATQDGGLSPPGAAAQEGGPPPTGVAAQEEGPPTTGTADQEGGPPTTGTSNQGSDPETFPQPQVAPTPAAIFQAPSPVLHVAQQSGSAPGFLQFTGRTAVWKDGLKLFRESPAIGFGFHADRLILKTHMHNSFMQALVQTGFAGAVTFLAAMLFVWVSLFNALRRLDQFPERHKHLVIQAGAILGFLTARAFIESTGAFFGIDWLILAPIMLYLHVISSNPQLAKDTA